MLSTLIVEDNVAHRLSLLRLLAGRFPSMRIDEAEDGKEAMRHVLGRHFDLVFMDVRLPEGNGLELTKAVKIVSSETVVCVITSYDILEYREAAFHNGADHFMVKGESTDAEIIDLVEGVLRTRFVTLIAVSDNLSRKQLNTLLAIRWPVMVVAEARDAEGALEHAAALRPDLVLLELGLPGTRAATLSRGIRFRSPHATLIGLTDDTMPAGRSMAGECGVDHCVPLTPMGHTELMGIVDSLQARRTHH